MLTAAGVPDPEGWIEGAERVRCSPTCASTVRARRERSGEQVDGLRVPLQLVARASRTPPSQGAHSQLDHPARLPGRPAADPTDAAGSPARTPTPSPRTGCPVASGELDEVTAATELARRGCERFGPGTTTDLQWWMGWTLGLTRRALEGCGAIAVSPGSTVRAGWPPTTSRSMSAEPWVALLPALDPTTMGWKQRSWYLPKPPARRSTRSATAVRRSGSTAASSGAWAQDKQGEVHLHYFEQVAAVRRREVDARVADLKAMVGDTRFAVRFPGNVHASVVTALFRCALHGLGRALDSRADDGRDAARLRRERHASSGSARGRRATRLPSSRERRRV